MSRRTYAHLIGGFAGKCHKLLRWVMIRKQSIPWAMAAARVLLGPVLVVGERCGWSGFSLASIVVTALLSDIFDGVLARRWRCDTAAVRLFDSMADTVFYLCAAAALWIAQPRVWQDNAILLGTLLSLEALRFGVDFVRFGKPASYHSWLAKSWGLVMALAIIATFGSSHASRLLPLALWLGIATDLEGLAMSLILPVWRRDVKTLAAAWRIRRELPQMAIPAPGASAACAVNRLAESRMRGPRSANMAGNRRLALPPPGFSA